MNQIKTQAEQIANEMNLTVGSVWGTKEATVYAFKAITGEVVKFNANGVIEEPKAEVVETKKAVKLSKYQALVVEIIKDENKKTLVDSGDRTSVYEKYEKDGEFYFSGAINQTTITALNKNGAIKETTDEDASVERHVSSFSFSVVCSFAVGFLGLTLFFFLILGAFFLKLS